jgi:hypothetical protein
LLNINVYLSSLNSNSNSVFLVVVEAETSDSPVVFSWVCHLVWGALANYPDWEAGILEIISHNSGG